MTTYDWHTTYRNAVETFAGHTPGPQLEQELLELFQHSPQTVTQAIQKAAAAYKTGNIHSPWGIVRTELNRTSNQPHIQVQDNRSQHHQLTQAEAWIRHTGLRLTANEVTAHLFAPPELTAPLEQLEQLEQDTRHNPGRPIYGPLLQAAIRRTQEHGREPVPNTGGPLTNQDTPALRQRMHTIWQEQQALATELQADDLERAETWKQQQTKRAQLQAELLAELDAQQRETVPATPAATAPDDDIPF